jgi:hypothetical protein
VGYKAVRPARGRSPAAGPEIPDDLDVDYDTADGVPDAFGDPLRTQ